MSPTKTAGQIFKSKLDVDTRSLDKYDSVGHAIYDRLSSFADQTLFIDAADGSQWTGRQILAAVDAIASCLLNKFNFEHQTFVFLCFDHSVESILLSLGVVAAGGCLFGCDDLLKYPEVRFLAERQRPKLWFSYNKRLEFGPQLERDLSHSMLVFSMENNDDVVDTAGRTVFSFKQMLKYSPSKDLVELKKAPVKCKSKRDDIAIMSVSSGTTGLPKSVPCSHANLLLMFKPRLNLNSMTVSSTTPIDYVSGRGVIFGCIWWGFKIVVVGKFQACSFLTQIERFKINKLFVGIAPLFELMSEANSKPHGHYNLKSLNCVFIGGAKLTPQFVETFRAFYAKNPQLEFVSVCYAMTEVPMISKDNKHPDDFLADPAGCGELADGVSVKIVDENNGQLLGANERGLIYVKTDLMLAGYYDARVCLADPTKSPIIADDAANSRQNFDADGFFKTNDIGLMSADGRQMYVEGRANETLCVRSAFKILPFELEAALCAHPLVAEACVVGVPSPVQFGQARPRAFVVLKRQVYNAAAAIETLHNFDELGAAEGHGELRKLTVAGNYDNQLEPLCTLKPRDKRLQVYRELSAHMSANLSLDKQLIGGLILIDKLPQLRQTGKYNKVYLRSLSVHDMEVFGELAE